MQMQALDGCLIFIKGISEVDNCDIMDSLGMGYAVGVLQLSIKDPAFMDVLHEEDLTSEV